VPAGADARLAGGVEHPVEMVWRDELACDVPDALVELLEPMSPRIHPAM
jgi:hypothetical protein